MSAHATTAAAEKSPSITYSEHVFVALGVQHHSHMWPARLYNIFPHYLIYGILFLKKKVTEHKMYFYFLYNFCLKHFYSKKK
jgi:hypothetical protein